MSCKNVFTLRWYACVLFLSPLAGCATLPLPRDPLAETQPAVETALPSTPAAESSPLVLVAGGDVLPGCFLDPLVQKEGHDYPYKKIAPYFQEADIGLVNLECPLTRRGRRFRNKKFTFRAQPDAAAALKRAGITAVSLGNNHIMDFGEQGLLDTLAALENAGLAYAGAGVNAAAARAPARLDLPRGRAALLSYSLTYPGEFWAASQKSGTALARLPQVEADVRSAAAWADLVIVCFHWGGELMHYPRAYQTEYGHAAIDAGADVVVGTHPHVLQGVEWYRRRLIFYSLGNLAFGGGKSRRATESALIKVVCTVAPKHLSAYVLPLNVDNMATAFVPAPKPGPDGAPVFQALAKYSEEWGTRLILDDSGWGELLPPETDAASTPLAPAETSP
ncbi:CapA family protein [candidate division FCPU426 bacterium]|nr:CapA family protein [candidate division FCPU426 bacterium]